MPRRIVGIKLDKTSFLAYHYLMVGIIMAYFKGKQRIAKLLYETRERTKQFSRGEIPEDYTAFQYPEYDYYPHLSWEESPAADKYFSFGG